MGFAFGLLFEESVPIKHIVSSWQGVDFAPAPAPGSGKEASPLSLVLRSLRHKNAGSFLLAPHWVELFDRRTARLFREEVDHYYPAIDNAGQAGRKLRFFYQAPSQRHHGRQLSMLDERDLVQIRGSCGIDSPAGL